jgi:ABC-type uncharacterized transport system substrate-binding protein
VISQSSSNNSDTDGKRLELLHQLAPSVTRIGLIYSTWYQQHLLSLQHSIDVAPQMGVELVPAGVTSTNASDPSAFDQVINAAIGNNAQAFDVFPPVKILRATSGSLHV